MLTKSYDNTCRHQATVSWVRYRLLWMGDVRSSRDRFKFRASRWIRTRPWAVHSITDLISVVDRFFVRQVTKVLLGCYVSARHLNYLKLVTPHQTILNLVGGSYFLMEDKMRQRGVSTATKCLFNAHNKFDPNKRWIIVKWINNTWFGWYIHAKQVNSRNN